MATTVSNVQITATEVVFKDGTNGYKVDAQGLDSKLNVQMHFRDPLKAMRYMFTLQKRLHLQINKVDLAAVSLSYQRAKAAAQSEAAEAIAETAQQTAEEVTAQADTEQPAAEEKPKRTRKPRKAKADDKAENKEVAK